MKSEVIDCTPNWEGSVNMLVTLVKDGNNEGRKYAIDQLRNMARLADKYVEQKKAAKEVALDEIEKQYPNT